MARSSSEFELDIPFSGLVVAHGYEKQPKGTSPSLQNVRLFDSHTGRRRLSKRPGLVKYASTQVATTPVQNLIQYIYASDTDGTGAQVRRTTTNLAVINGDLFKFNGTSVGAITSGGGSLLSTTRHQIFSARLFGDVFFVDGTNNKKYVGSTDTASSWTATTAGTLPTGARLIEMWRGRIVLSGIASEPHNWYLSRLGDAYDWDVSPDPIDATMPVAGNSSDVGEIGDVVTSMIPYSDDMLIFGCDHSIWVMSGDPADGGRIDNVSETVGMAWGRPWCTTPEKTVYFMGSRGSVYRFIPGQSIPERVTSQTIDELLATVDLQSTIIRMAHDDRQQTVHLWLTTIGGTTPDTHYVYDIRNDAWLVDVYGHYGLDPSAVMVMDGDDPDDRCIILGGRDGKIRKIGYTEVNDDGYAIDSYCWLPPVYFKNYPTCILKEMEVITGKNTDSLTVSTHAADLAEDALTANPAYSRTFGPGDNYLERRRAVGTHIWTKLANSNLDEHWSLEYIRVVVDQATGKGTR